MSLTPEIRLRLDSEIQEILDQKTLIGLESKYEVFDARTFEHKRSIEMKKPVSQEALTELAQYVDKGVNAFNSTALKNSLSAELAEKGRPKTKFKL